MIKIARWTLSILLAILIWPIVIMITITALVAALTIGLISAIAMWLYKASNE